MVIELYNGLRLRLKDKNHTSSIISSPKVNIAEKFYTKLDIMNKGLNIRLCVNDNAFSEFHNVLYNEINIIITSYRTASKCLGDIVEEYYIRKQRLEYFFVIDEARMLLQHIGLID